MATISEQTTQIVTARLTRRDMSIEELQKEIAIIAASLNAIDTACVEVAQEQPKAVVPEKLAPYKPKKPVHNPLDFSDVFRDDKVVCLECGKEFGSLSRHITHTHNITENEYKKKYNIPAKQKLVAKNISDKARKSAIDRGQGAVLAKGRAGKKVVEEVTGA